MLDPLAADRPTIRAKPRLPFAARFQGVLIGVMFVAILMIAQQSSKTLYQIGLPLLVVAALLQFAFGNIPPSSGFAKSMKLLLLTWAIVAVIFAIGIYLAPTLIDLGRSEETAPAGASVGGQ